jgi:hypothetical protein
VPEIQPLSTGFLGNPLDLNPNLNLNPPPFCVCREKEPGRETLMKLGKASVVNEGYVFLKRGGGKRGDGTADGHGNEKVTGVTKM